MAHIENRDNYMYSHEYQKVAKKLVTEINEWVRDTVWLELAEDLTTRSHRQSDTNEASVLNLLHNGTKNINY